jgi:aminopeptidase N
MALEKFDAYKGADSISMMATLVQIANKDPKRAVRAKALEVLASNGADKYQDLFLKGLNDSAYSVVASAIVGYSMTKNADRLHRIAGFETSDNKDVLNALAEVYAEEADSNKFKWFSSKISKLSGTELYYFITDFTTYINKMEGSMQAQAITILEPMARTNATWYIKYGAFKAIASLTKIKDKQALLQDINGKETDEKVKKYYARVLAK